MGPHQGRAEGEKNLPRPTGHTPLNAPQDPTGLLGNQGTLLAHGQPVIPRDTQVPLRRAALQQVRPSLYWCMGLFLPRCRTLHLPWLNFVRFLSAQLSSLSRSMAVPAQPPRCPAILTPQRIRHGHLAGRRVSRGYMSGRCWCKPGCRRWALAIYFLTSFRSSAPKWASRPDTALSKFYVQLYLLIAQISYYKNKKKQQQLVTWLSLSALVKNTQPLEQLTTCR